MIQIVHPTLADYLSTVRGMALKYGCNSWLDLKPEIMSEDDQSQYSFIEHTVGNELILQEFGFDSEDRSPGEENFEYASTAEPGQFPGLAFFRGMDICLPNIMQNSSIATCPPVNS